MHTINLFIFIETFFMKPQETVDFHIRWSWYNISRMYNSKANEFGGTMSIGYALLKNKWNFSEMLFSLRKKTIEFRVQRKEENELKKKIINRDVDIILEKIKDVGFSGLSDEEQSKLYEASKKMSKDGDRD